MGRYCLHSLIVLLLFICNSIGGNDASQPFSDNPKLIIKGYIINSEDKMPVSFADISCSDRTSFAKSNFEGEFSLNPSYFPLNIRLRKTGFKEENITIQSPVDSVHVSMTPLIYHRNSIGLDKPLQYDLLLKRALEKLRKSVKSLSAENNQEKLVHCRIITLLDSTMNSFFESYMLMDATKSEFKLSESGISRYSSINKPIPGLSENKLEFETDPFINLPMFIEKYIGKRGYLKDNNKLIAVINVNLDNTKNIYYLNVTDTTIIHISSRLKTGEE